MKLKYILHNKRLAKSLFMNLNLEIELSCEYKYDRNFNTDWHFGMFEKGKDNGHEAWKMFISK